MPRSSSWHPNQLQCWSHLSKTGTTSSWAHCPTCSMPRPQATRSSQTGQRRLQTHLCGTWRKKICPLSRPTWACWANTRRSPCPCAVCPLLCVQCSLSYPVLPLPSTSSFLLGDRAKQGPRRGRVPEWTKCSNREKRKEKEKPFYSDSEGESGPTESADSDPESESASDSKSSSESGSGESSSESDSEDQEEEKGRSSESEQSEEEGEKRKMKKRKKVPEGQGGGSSSEEDSDSSSGSSESERTSETEEEQVEPASWRKKTPPSGKSAPVAKEISLLDLEDFTPPSVQPVSPPTIVSTSLATDLEGLTLTDSPLVPSLLSPVVGVGRQELLHRVAGEGLAVDYTFSRQPFSGDPHMVSVHIHFSNSSDTPIKGLHVGTPKLPAGISIQEFPEIESLAPGESVTAVMGINFCDSTQAANFQLCTQTRQFYVSIQPPVGELMAPVFMSENEFKKEQGKLTGMSEITEKLTLPDTCRNDHIVVQRVTAVANLGRVPCGASDEYRFAGRTLTSGSLVLLTLDARPTGAAQLTVNSEKMVIGTMLVKDVVQALTQ
ncbi:AP-3 complex subunit beta-2 isoform X3 [Prionailurus viverrinus]|uniref:AP-3 complex subunit beta-2 isoform X3 n=1 Tax=Prionailurus viverrinus TaxID=61388 RepID=UPI001FF39195|nr:AP-3 complex subunit beta-2 isoform X3 [Prionailurus viverrinus]